MTKFGKKTVFRLKAQHLAAVALLILGCAAEDPPSEDDLCANVVCGETAGSCEGNTAYAPSGGGVCDPKTGYCLGPGSPPQDCAAEGLVCKDGLCVAGRELCKDVVCYDLPGSCEGNTAYGPSSGGVCDPETGECQVAPGSPRQDCDAQGLVCKDGLCVESQDLCEDVECPGSDGSCEGNIAYAPVAEGICDPATGDCQYPLGPPPKDCTADELTCQDGACIQDKCAGLACTGTPSLCEAGKGWPGTPDGVCNPASGECEYPPTLPSVDCWAEGLVCEDGLCVANPEECGGVDDLKCPDGQACDLLGCGVEILGMCVGGNGCPENYKPVCGCDGVTYDNDCQRIHEGGTALSYKAACEGNSCAPMDAEGEGACQLIKGFIWNGKGCQSITGCSCKGKDCDKIFATKEACHVAYAGCLFGNSTINPTSCGEFGAGKQDPYQLQAAAVEGDVLVLNLSYDGGCETHKFGACFGEVIPAALDIIEITISHDSNGDTCEANVSDQIFIDLLPLQAYYKEATMAINGTIKLVLDGMAEPVYYSF